MVAIAGAGNEAEDWDAWGGLDQLRPARWGPPGRVVVVTAHPGDEVIGLGGTLQTLIGAGHHVEVINLAGTSEADEATRSLDELGVGPIPVVTIAGAGRD